MDINDYSYFIKYRNSLTQYILFNCCIPSGNNERQKKKGRINLTEQELLGLLKELQDINLYCKLLDDNKLMN